MEMIFTTENFDTEVLQSEIPAVVDFFSVWCGPCKMMAPVFESLASEYEGKVKIGKLEVDENQEIAARYRVMSIPTIILVKNGQLVKKFTGVTSKDALQAEIIKML